MRLVADSLFAGQQVVWSTGRIGQGRDTLIAPGPGRYAVNVTGVCGDFRDTITITAGPAQPIRIAPRPLASCPGGELAFGVQSPGGQAAEPA